MFENPYLRDVYPPATINLIISPKSLPSFIQSLFMIAVASVIQLILAWYFNQSPIGASGYELSFLFPFSKSYWEFEYDQKRNTELNGLSKDYNNGQGLSLNNFSFQFLKGNIYVLLGPNGAGKSTLCSIMTGLITPTGGTGVILGSPLHQVHHARHEMGICTQEEVFVESFTAMDHVRFYAHFRNIDWSPFGSLEAYALDLLSKVHLDTSIQEKVVHFSGGMQRRLSFILSTIGSTELFFLDEPTTGLDLVSKRDVWDIVRNLKRDAVVILTTHDMMEAEQLADQVLIINDGQLKESGTVLELQEKYRDFGRLTVSQTSNDCDVGLLEEWILCKAPQIWTASISINAVSVIVRKCQSSMVARLCRLIEHEKGLQWRMKSSSVEDIFLLISNGEIILKEEFETAKDVAEVGFSEFIKDTSSKLLAKAIVSPPKINWQVTRNVQLKAQVGRMSKMIRKEYVSWVAYGWWMFYIFDGLTTVKATSALIDIEIDPFPSLAPIIAFSVSIASVRIASLISSELKSSSFQHMRYQGIDMKIYWCAILIVSCVLAAIFVLSTILFLLIAVIGFTNYFALPVLLPAMTSCVSLGIFVAGVFQWHYSSAYMVIALFFLSNTTQTGVWWSSFVPIWSITDLLVISRNGTIEIVPFMVTLGTHLVFFCIGMIALQWKYLVNPTFVVKTLDSPKHHTQVPFGTATESTPLDVCVDIKNLTQSYGSKHVLKDIDLQLLHGESFCLLGPNGAGKTTLLRTLFDPLLDKRGSIECFKYPEHQGSFIGLCPQQNVYWDFFTVQEHMDLYGQLFGVGKEDIPCWVDYISKLALVDSKMLSKLPIQLAGGMKRRLAIAISLSVNPCLVIMDEPTAGVDPGTKKSLWKALRSICADGRRTMFFTSHCMTENETLSDRVAIIVDGHFKAKGRVEDLKSKYSHKLKVELTLYLGTIVNESLQYSLLSELKEKLDFASYWKALSPRLNGTYYYLDIEIGFSCISCIDVVLELLWNQFTLQQYRTW